MKYQNKALYKVIKIIVRKAFVVKDVTLFYRRRTLTLLHQPHTEHSGAKFYVRGNYSSHRTHIFLISFLPFKEVSSTRRS